MSRTYSTVAVVGAVGSFYGGLLARAGHAVTLVGRAAHVEAIARDGLRVEWADRSERIRVGASAGLAAARGADIVLVCVKSNDTEATARELAPLLPERAVVVSLQNGVDNPRLLKLHLRQTVIPVAVYVALALPAAGVVRHFGRGDLVIGAMRGEPAGASEAGSIDVVLGRLVELFATADVAVRISADVMVELWGKLVINCAYNGISALAQIPYARLAAVAEIRTLQRAIVDEAVAVAAADGVTLSAEASMLAVEAIAAGMPEQLSSTAQDLARGKRSEIDHLNGFVARRGSELGLAAPVNQALHALVKLVESNRGTR